MIICAAEEEAPRFALYSLHVSRNWRRMNKSCREREERGVAKRRRETNQWLRTLQGWCGKGCHQTRSRVETRSPWSPRPACQTQLLQEDRRIKMLPFKLLKGISYDLINEEVYCSLFFSCHSCPWGTFLPPCLRQQIFVAEVIFRNALCLVLFTNFLPHPLTYPLMFYRML